MPKSTEKKFRASWMKNSYQGPKAVDPGALRRGYFRKQGAIMGEDNDCPPVALPATAGSIVNFDRCAVGIA